MSVVSGTGARRPRMRAGFTLLELMLVVVVVGIVMSMSAGRIHSFLLQQRVARAATSMQNDLAAAFAIAGRNRTPVRIAWDSAAMQLGVTNRAGTIFFRKTSLAGSSYGFSTSSIRFSRTPLEIYPNGLANDTLKITVTGTTSSRSVRVTRAGLIRVE